MPESNRTVRRGFTLVEAVATMSILAVVSISASRIIFAATGAYAADAARAELTMDLSAAMERIAGELRSVPSRTASPGTPWIESAAADAVSFGGSGGLALVGNELRLTPIGGAPHTLLDGVTSFSINCYDEAGQTLTLPLSGAGCDVIRRVQVAVTRTRYGVTETLRTRVYLRCAIIGGGA